TRFAPGLQHLQKHHREAVVVRAGLQAHAQAELAPIVGEGIGLHVLECVAGVRPAVDVGDGRRHVGGTRIIHRLLPSEDKKKSTPSNRSASSACVRGRPVTAHPGQADEGRTWTCCAAREWQCWKRRAVRFSWTYSITERGTLSSGSSGCTASRFFDWIGAMWCVASRGRAFVVTRRQGRESSR